MVGRKAHLLIVDDHPVVRQGIAELINRQDDLYVCAQAGCAGEAMHLLRQRPFDAVIIDLSLEGVSGLELIRLIQAENKMLPILVLSAHDELFFAERVMRAGARGYVMKQEATRSVISAIRQVLSGEIYVSEEIGRRMLHRFIDGEATGPGTPVERLSDRELEVFQLIGQGYATPQIAEMLHLSAKTVESYRASVKRKLQLRSGGKLVQQATQWVQRAKET